MAVRTRSNTGRRRLSDRKFRRARDFCTTPLYEPLLIRHCQIARQKWLFFNGSQNSIEYRSKKAFVREFGSLQRQRTQHVNSQHPSVAKPAEGINNQLRTFIRQSDVRWIVMTDVVSRGSWQVWALENESGGSLPLGREKDGQRSTVAGNNRQLLF